MIEAIEATALATWLRHSTVAYPILSALHVAATGGLVVLALWLDLVLLGLARGASTRALQAAAATAGGGAALTGALLFSVAAGDYLENPAFRAKLALLALALANVALAHASGAWPRRERPGPLLRATAAASLVLWPAVLLAGRFIGFV